MAAEPDEFSFNLDDWDAYESGLGPEEPPATRSSEEPPASPPGEPSASPTQPQQEFPPEESQAPEEPPPELSISFQDLLRMVGNVDLEKLKETLASLGIVISDDFLKEIMEMNPKDMESALLSFGVLNEDEFLDVLAKQAGLGRVNLSEIEVTPALLGEIPADLVRRFRVFPVRATKTTLWFAMGDPLDIRMVDELGKHLKKTLIPMVAREKEIDEFIQRFYPEEGTG
jgi:hypothetical protein